VERLRDIEGLRNLTHTYEDVREELVIKLKRARTADFNVSVGDIGQALTVALDGLVVTDFIDGDRKFDVRLRLPASEIMTTDDIGNVIVALRDDQPIRLRHLADVTFIPAPDNIMRYRQARTVEISASITEGYSLEGVMKEVNNRWESLEPLPATVDMMTAR
jgi:multidrug efflux pump subunit AcrB